MHFDKGQSNSRVSLTRLLSREERVKRQNKTRKVCFMLSAFQISVFCHCLWGEQLVIGGTSLRGRRGVTSDKFAYLRYDGHRHTIDIIYYLLILISQGKWTPTAESDRSNLITYVQFALFFFCNSL